jgi:hypothetical protein
MRKHLKPSPALAALALALGLASGASAQTFPLDLEVGYRFLSVSGNKDMYRTQVNEKEGFLVRSLTLAPDFTDKDGFLDTLRLYVSDIGPAGPNGAARLEIGKTRTFRLRASYMRSELFSKLPAFDNPLLDQGITPGQHTQDRRRNMVDVELEVFPNCSVTPIVGYSWNRYEGPARTTYHFGQDEFRLSQDLRNTEQEVRFGAAFDAGPVTGQFIQGFRKVHEIETVGLAPGEQSGNNPGSVLGQTLSINGFQRTSTADVNTPVTSAALAVRASKDLKFTGTYVKANASGDSSELEGSNGSFVSFPIARFFGGYSDTISTSARNSFYRWGARAEFQVVDGVDLSGGWTRRHNQFAGFALVSALYANTRTFGGATAADVQTLLNANTTLERTEDIYDVRLTARALGPFLLSVGWTGTDQDLNVSPDPSEIVVPGSQGGAFSRTIGQFDARGTFTIKGLTLVAQVAMASANRAVLRTDFVDRVSYKLRATVNPLTFFTLGASVERLEDKNDAFLYKSRATRYAGDIEVRPVKPVALRFSAGRYYTFSTIPVRIPWNFATDTSVNSENGHSYEGGLTLSFGRVSLDGSYGSFDNVGTFPYTLDRGRARLEIGLVSNFAVVGEWGRDKYSEKVAGLFPFGDYAANRYGVYLRIKP